MKGKWLSELNFVTFENSVHAFHIFLCFEWRFTIIRFLFFYSSNSLFNVRKETHEMSEREQNLRPLPLEIKVDQARFNRSINCWDKDRSDSPLIGSCLGFAVITNLPPSKQVCRCSDIRCILAICLHTWSWSGIILCSYCRFVFSSENATFLKSTDGQTDVFW